MRWFSHTVGIRAVSRKTIAAGVAKWWTLIGETDGVNRIGYIGGSTREHQSDTVYTTGGVSRTLTATEYKHPALIIDEKD